MQNIPILLKSKAIRTNDAIALTDCHCSKSRSVKEGGVNKMQNVSMKLTQPLSKLSMEPGH